MSPNERSDRQAELLTACLGCGGPIPPHRTMSCDLCVRASEIACEQRQHGQTILPSDIARIRETLG